MENNTPPQLSFLEQLANVEEERDHSIELRLDELAKAFVRLEHPTPQDFSVYWQLRWRYLATRIPEFTVDVPDCDRTIEEIRELEAEGRTLIYKPPGITLDRLRLMHPGKEIRPSKGILSEEHPGWLDVTSQMDDIPKIWRDEGKTITRIEQEQIGRFPMTLETFFITVFNDSQLGCVSKNKYKFVNLLSGTILTDFF